MSSILKAFVIGLGFAVLLVLALYVFQSASSPHFQSGAPTDETLDANFRAHKKALESLVEMSGTDRSVIRIANDFTWLETDSSWPRPEGKLGFSEERWNQYRALFREAGLPGGILRENKEDITYLIHWNQGLMTNGSLKGYAYSEKELTPVVSSLDDVNSWPKGQRVIFKKLEGHWYLFVMSS